MIRSQVFYRINVGMQFICITRLLKNAIAYFARKLTFPCGSFVGRLNMYVPAAQVLILGPDMPSSSLSELRQHLLDSPTLVQAPMVAADPVTREITIMLPNSRSWPAKLRE